MRRLLVILAIVAAVLVYFGYREVYPSDRFYLGEFTSGCQTTLSASARVVCARVDFPPHLGDYTSEALIDLDASDFARLLAELQTRTHLSPCTADPVMQVCGRKLDVQTCVWDLTPGHDWIVWGLLRDGKTLFFRAIIT